MRYTTTCKRRPINNCVGVVLRGMHLHLFMCIDVTLHCITTCIDIYILFAIYIFTYLCILLKFCIIWQRIFIYVYSSLYTLASVVCINVTLYTTTYNVICIFFAVYIYICICLCILLSLVLYNNVYLYSYICIRVSVDAVKSSIFEIQRHLCQSDALLFFSYDR